MNKVISLYDLLKADQFKGMTQFDLIDLNNLDKVNEVLEVLGFDIDKPICVEANQHRTLSGEVKVGYLFKGYISRKREHVYGQYSTVHDMFAYAEGEGQDWYDELIGMQSRCVNYGTQDALDDKIPERGDPIYRAEENRILNEIAQLEAILFVARGDQRKSDGSYKCAYDYKNPEVPVEKRKRRKSKKKQQEGNVNE